MEKGDMSVGQESNNRKNKKSFSVGKYSTCKCMVHDVGAEQNKHRHKADSLINEPLHGKANNLHRRKQRHRSASQ